MPQIGPKLFFVNEFASVTPKSRIPGFYVATGEADLAKAYKARVELELGHELSLFPEWSNR